MDLDKTHLQKLVQKEMMFISHICIARAQLINDAGQIQQPEIGPPTHHIN